MLGSEVLKKLVFLNAYHSSLYKVQQSKLIYKYFYDQTRKLIIKRLKQNK